MATIKGPKGRMTQPLVTKYDVGDVVLLVAFAGFEDISMLTDRPIGETLHLGDVGTIRKIFIEDAEVAGDDGAYLVFDVHFDGYGGRMLVGDEEITPYSDGVAWLQKQLNTLNLGNPKEEA